MANTVAGLFMSVGRCCHSENTHFKRFFACRLVCRPVSVCCYFGIILKRALQLYAYVHFVVVVAPLPAILSDHSAVESVYVTSLAYSARLLDLDFGGPEKR